MTEFPLIEFLDWLKKQPNNRTFTFINGLKSEYIQNKQCCILCSFLAETQPHIKDFSVSTDFINLKPGCMYIPRIIQALSVPELESAKLTKDKLCPL